MGDLQDPKVEVCWYHLKHTPHISLVCGRYLPNGSMGQNLASQMPFGKINKTLQSHKPSPHGWIYFNMCHKIIPWDFINYIL